MVTARFCTRWMVLLISMFLLSACGGDDSTTSNSLTSEGTATTPFFTPLPVNTETPYSGQVGNKAAGKSYYTTATVTPNTTYTITLYGLSADVDLEVYNDRPFDYILGPECASRNGSTTVEYCTVTAIGATMNIAVDGQYTLEGATFSISVNGPFVPATWPCSGTDCFNFDTGFTGGETSFGFVQSNTVPPQWSVDCTPANNVTGSGCNIHSGALSSSETSCVSYTPANATSYVSFNLKANSQKYFGLLLFYVDDVLQPPVWSGTVAWQQVIFNNVSGTHTYKWCHSQNSATPTTPDDVWVDDIVIK